MDQKRKKMKQSLFFLLIVLFMAGCTSNPEPGKADDKKVIRKGSVIKVKQEKLELYKELHAHPWEGVDQKLKECNIQNYSIFYRDGYLFSYMEYTGDDWEADMERLAADSTIQEWWDLTVPCQEPIPTAKEGEWWADMEEVYHLD
jgi:L-rhamnose mutarotase